MRHEVRHAWYVLAWSDEVGGAPLARRVLEQPVVVFRQQDGRAVALLDRCAHKLVPLSLGEVVGDTLQCAYHGLRFDGRGRCVHVPGQRQIPASACVRAFPLIERYGALWIWMGDADQADPGRLPTIERYDTPGWAVLRGAPSRHQTHYLNIVENLQDPAHTTYVHRRTIGNPASDGVMPTTEVHADHIVTYRWTRNSPPPPIEHQSGQFAGLTDRCQYYRFYPPCVSRVDVATIDAGTAATEANLDRGRRAFSYKFLTPETDTSTHFFWLHIRNFSLHDAAVEAELRDAFTQTFEEDNVITSALQREQDATGVRQMTWLDIDAGPSRARRWIEAMAAAERTAEAGGDPPHATASP